MIKYIGNEIKLRALRRELSAAGDRRDWYGCNRIENEINKLTGDPKRWEEYKGDPNATPDEEDDNRKHE